jgi:hypothetical protein
MHSGLLRHQWGATQSHAENQAREPKTKRRFSSGPVMCGTLTMGQDNIGNEAERLNLRILPGRGMTQLDIGKIDDP